MPWFNRAVSWWKIYTFTMVQFSCVYRKYDGFQSPQLILNIKPAAKTETFSLFVVISLIIERVRLTIRFTCFWVCFKILKEKLKLQFRVLPSIGQI